MSKIPLWVIDVSPVIYVGTLAPRYCERQNYGYPVGGLHYLNNYISLVGADGADVVFCFDSPTNRVELCETYKNNRSSNATVISNMKIAMQQLQNCGFPVLKIDGYESDDLVYSVVKKYLPEYSEIKIVTNDMDISHNVQPNVTIRACSSQSPSVDMENFTVIVHKGARVKWNTISAYKVFCGCKSDCVKGISGIDGTSGEALYQMYCEWLETNRCFTYEKTSSSESLRAFAEETGNIDMTLLDKQISVIFPRLVDVEVGGDLKLNRFKDYLALCGDWQTAQSLGFDKPMTNKQQRDYLDTMKKELQDAPVSYGVRKPIQIHTTDLDAFSKEAPW